MFNQDWRERHEAETAEESEARSDFSSVQRLQDRLLGGQGQGLSSGQILGDLPPVNIDQIPEVFRRSLWEPNSPAEPAPASAPTSGPGQSLHRAPVEEPKEEPVENEVEEALEPVEEISAEDAVASEPEIEEAAELAEEEELVAEEAAVAEPELEVAAEIAAEEEPELEPEVEEVAAAEPEEVASEPAVEEIFAIAEPEEIEVSVFSAREPILDEPQVEEIAAEAEPDEIEPIVAVEEDEEEWVPPVVERPAAPSPPPVIAWSDFDDEPEAAAQDEEHHALNMAPAAHMDEEVSDEPVPQFDVKVLFSSDPLDELDDEEEAKAAPAPDELKENGWGSVPSVFLKSPLAPQSFQAPEVEPVAAFEEPEVLLSGDPEPAAEVSAPPVFAEPQWEEAVEEPEPVVAEELSASPVLEEPEEMAAEIEEPPVTDEPEVEEVVAEELVAEPEPEEPAAEIAQETEGPELEEAAVAEPEPEIEPETEEVAVPPVMDEPAAEIEEEVAETAAEVSEPLVIEESEVEELAAAEPEFEPEPEELAAEEVLTPPVMQEPEPEVEPAAELEDDEPVVPEVFRTAHLKVGEPAQPVEEPAILFAAPEDEEPIHDINQDLVAQIPDEKVSHIGAPKAPKTYRWRRLGQLLQELGLVTESQVQEALDEQRISRKPLGQILVELGTISEKTLLQALASQIDVEVWYMDEQEADRAVVHLLDEAFSRKYQLIALMKEGNEIVLGMKNPADLDAIELVKRRTNCRVRPVLVDEGKLSNALDEYFSPIEKLKAQAAPEEDGERDEIAEAMKRAAAELEEEESYPIVETVDGVILDAIKMKASDIHFEPRESMLEVRYRLDGQLLRVREFPRDILPMIIARIKIMAEVDLVEWRVPQDGRISVDLENRTVDMRVSILPSLYGQRIVMRVLDKSAAMLGLDQLGFSKHNLTLFRRLIRRPYGLFLVTGPTGSGKTTTLYAALNEVRSSSNNVMTCEDPVEYDIDGINQSQVNEKVGLTFAQQLRAILRQDPDIVLVGEIRDHETAETAIKASMTGHMVFSTLHCNDAPGALPRLYDMNLDASNLSTSLIGVMGQRLLRKLCTHCKEEYTPDEEEQELLRNSFGSTKVKKLYQAKGCSRCHGTGYKGRMAVHEILPVTHEIAALIQERRPVEEIRTTARYYGYRTMQEDTLDRLMAGQTSLKEAQRLLAFDDIPRLDDPEKYYRDLQKQAS